MLRLVFIALLVLQYWARLYFIELVSQHKAVIRDFKDLRGFRVLKDFRDLKVEVLSEF